MRRVSGERMVRISSAAAPQHTGRHDATPSTRMTETAPRSRHQHITQPHASTIDRPLSGQSASSGGDRQHPALVASHAQPATWNGHQPRWHRDRTRAQTRVLGAERRLRPRPTGRRDPHKTRKAGDHAGDRLHSGRAVHLRRRAESPETRRILRQTRSSLGSGRAELCYPGDVYEPCNKRVTRVVCYTPTSQIRLQSPVGCRSAPTVGTPATADLRRSPPTLGVGRSGTYNHRLSRS